MKLKQTLVTVISALAFAGAALGGTVAAPEPVEYYTVDRISGTLSAGYDSHYVFRGVTLGEDAVWTGLDLSANLIDSIDISGGAWYNNSTRRGGDELDLYVSLGTTVGPVELGVGYVRYFYPTSDAEQTGEIVATVGTSLGYFDLGGFYAYDHDLETHYFEGQVDLELAINNSLGLDLGVAVGFNEDEYSHSALTVALPFTVKENVTFTPYVTGITRDSSQHPGESSEELIGGASLSVSF